MNGKKANVVPVHKKGNKQSLENYRPTFFTENNLISPNQSGFRPGDSCVNQ